MVQIHKQILSTTHTDIQNKAFVYRLAPDAWHPYINVMRLDRPVGVYLLFLPCLFGLLAGYSINPIPLFQLFYFIALCAIGSIIMRGAGCIINDLWDQNIDQQVERTRLRPIASGALSIPNALVFLVILLAIGLVILLQFSMPSIVIGFISMIPVILYPLAKRVTWYPQLALGITFNIGVLIAGASVVTSSNILDYLPLALIYLGTIFWTFGYDTVYASQDIEDDARIGVKSSALKFGAWSFELVLGLYSLMSLCLGIALLLLDTGFLGWGLYIIAMGHILWNHHHWQAHDPADSLARFKSHIVSGILIASMFAV
jgi:4-hydroxybenzoate polyprenyltransferase